MADMKPKTTRKGRQERQNNDDDLIYQQTPLHAIDQAREPKGATGFGRHAVSAADILNQSLNNLDSSSNHHRRGSSKDHTTDSHRSASFILQGSATSLLKQGGPAAAAVNVRMRSYSETKEPKDAAALVGGGSSTASSPVRSSTTSPVPNMDGSSKRRGYSSKGISQQKAAPKALGDLDDSSGGDLQSSGGGNVGGANNSSPSSNSDDSYDANGSGTGVESDDKFEEHNNTTIDVRSSMMNRQVSNLSGGKILAGSVADLSVYSDDDYDDDDEFPGSISTEEDNVRHFSCCGIRTCKVRRCIKSNRVASATVRYAPCFWCFPIPVSATDRTILTRLNIISAFFAIGQVVATIWLVVILLIPPNADHEQDAEYGLTHGMQPNLWSLTGSMYSVGFFGAIIFVSNLVTLKVIQVVNLLGAIRYLWVLLWLIPCEIFFVISLLDFYNVTHVWIKHWWLVPSMAWFRETYCEPGTAGTLCMVPLFPEDSEYNETDWCMDQYQATNCSDVRDEAQHETEEMLLFFFNGNAAWGAALLMVLFLIVTTLERIISRPMVQKSRESNVPAWLSLPTIFCSVVGAVFRYSPSSVLSARSGSTYSWIGTAYMACGVLFFLTAILGWFISTFSILSGRDKRYKHISVIFFIFLMTVTSFILTIIFVASVSYSVALVDIPIGGDMTDTIACGVDTADSCSNCDGLIEGMDLCPEWNLDDVTRVLQTQTKGSATLAIIFFLYSFSALRFGFVLRKHVTMYQIDYV